MFRSRLAAVVPVATDFSLLPDSTWTTRREVVLRNGAQGNSNSSSITKARQASNSNSSLAKAGQEDSSNSKVRAGEVAVRGETAGRGKIIDPSRICAPTAATETSGTR